jgi:hypothetical protein
VESQEFEKIPRQNLQVIGISIGKPAVQAFAGAAAEDYISTIAPDIEPWPASAERALTLAVER